METSYLRQVNSLWVAVILVLLQFLACRNNETGSDFQITSFIALTNSEFEFQPDTTTVLLQVDLENAVLGGIRIPTENQCQGGKLGFKFKVKRSNESNEQLFYKLYYQNASYKFDESNPLCNENFYGSWVDASIGFKPLPDFSDEIEIRDSLVIQGNPRNEELYFGESPLLELIDADSVREQMKLIKSNSDWYTTIVEKAKKEGRTPEKQLRLDAEWIVKQRLVNLLHVNNYTWRNPRVGEYEFMLVVLSKTDLKKLPSHQIKLSNRDGFGGYVNPFAFFEIEHGACSHTIQRVISGRRLKVFANYQPGNGIYVPAPNDSLPNRKFYSQTCGDSEYLYKNAHFQQYFSDIDEANPIRNTPIVEAVLSPSFTIDSYNTLRRKYSNSTNAKLGSIRNSDCACENVHSKLNGKKIELVNEGNENATSPSKENIGVQGRIGMTYGKWVAKIKFPDVLNSQQVWTGIANAFRLISQSPNSGWNQRRVCNHPLAYIPPSAKDVEGSSLHRNGTIGYSRIDLEVVCASGKWPGESSATSNSDGDKARNGDAGIMAVCSNWDLACHEPSDFFTGIKTSLIDGLPFQHFRANDWQKQLVSKTPIEFSEFSANDYYYFEIEWLPTKIVWRIGPERDRMKVICIMDDSMTSIPNNQMLPVFAQEWQRTASWSMSPFSQEFIPCPKEDFVGKILELWVE